MKSQNFPFTQAKIQAERKGRLLTWLAALALAAVPAVLGSLHSLSLATTLGILGASAAAFLFLR